MPNKHPDLFTTDTLKFGFFEPPGQKNLGPVYYQEVWKIRSKIAVFGDWKEVSFVLKYREVRKSGGKITVIRWKKEFSFVLNYWEV